MGINIPVLVAQLREGEAACRAKAEQAAAGAKVLTGVRPVEAGAKAYDSAFAEGQAEALKTVAEILVEMPDDDKLRKFGPLDEDFSKPCAACEQPVKAGEYATIVPLGPGEDTEERQRAREGRPYNAIGLVCHWACATGEEGE